MDRIKLFYIMGTDRSGSTLLDMIIGASPEFFSLGESHRFHLYSNSTELLCSCGVPLRECAFWSGVEEKLEGKAGWQPELMMPLGWKKRFLIHTLDRILPGVFTGAYIKRYAEANRMFFQAVLEVSGAGCVVDSSKDAVRAYMLHKSGLFDIVPIYITRAVEDYIISVKTPQPGRKKGVSIGRRKAILKWVFRNLETRLIAGRIRKDYVQISYEKFARNPDASTKEISSFYNVPLVYNIDDIAGGEYHVIGGNNMKFRNFSGVRYDRKEGSTGQTSFITKAVNRLFVRDNICH